MTTYTEDACPYKKDCPYPGHKHTPQPNDSELTLDEAANRFKGYVLEENDFDELDFKEYLLNWRNTHTAKVLNTLYDEFSSLPTWETSTMIEGQEVLDIIKAKREELTHDN